MSLPFSVLVARACAKEPHKSALTVARELSAKLNAARKIKRERAQQARPKLYATKSSWMSGYDNY
jgi:hypothetical protein